MIQEYVPKEIRPIGTPDDYGNQAYSVTFSNNENALLRAKKAPAVGVTEYGEILDAPKKDGSGTYKKFKRHQKEQQSFSRQPQTKSFTADPGKISSIEWQKAIAEGRQLVHDWITTSAEPQSLSLEEYKVQVVNTAVTLAAAINKKPEHLIEEPVDEQEPAGVGGLPEDTTTDDDLPPVENYDGYF